MATSKIKSDSIDTIAAAKLTGTVDNARITLDAAEIPNISTDKLTTGTLPDARIAALTGNKLTGAIIAQGDGSSTDGKITLNCSQNTHGVSIQSPAHVTNSSYTLTLPTTDGNANELLKTDGGGVLSWAVDSGGGPSLGANHIIRTNSTEINENITFPASAPFVNGSSVGPITITGSYTVTIPAGNTYTII